MSADTTWPGSLTRTPRVAELQEDAPAIVIRSEVDAGPAKIRRRFTGDLRRFTIGLDLRRSEVEVFDLWFREQTYGGALSFSWKHPRKGTAADFRFLSTPTYRPKAPRGDGNEWWTVSFDVEMLPGTDSSIAPPGGVIDPAGGGNWPIWIANSDPVEQAMEIEEEAVVPEFFREADAAPPVFLFAYITTNLGREAEDEDLYFDDTVVSGGSFVLESTANGSSSNGTFSPGGGGNVVPEEA